MKQQRSELEARITQLESALAYQQHEFDQLNRVVVDQASLLTELQRQNAQLEACVQRVVQEMPAVPECNVDDERPPHY